MSVNTNHHTEAKKPLAIDVFCGVGGMSLGFQKAGFNIVAAIDNDPINIKSYRSNFPSTNAFEADISKLTGSDILDLTGYPLGAIDVVFGGPPCQGYSTIGRREENDHRNKLLFHFAMLVEQIKPRYFILENVPGILNGYAAKNLEVFERQINGSGYKIANPVWMLNSIDFGVPQDRKRAFLVGSRMGLASIDYPQAMPFISKDGEPYHVTVWDAIGDLRVIDEFQDLIKFDRYVGQLGKSSEFSAMLRNGTSKVRNDNRMDIKSRGLGGCAQTNHRKQTVKRFSRLDPGQVDKVSRAKRLHPKGVSTTLRAGSGPDRGSHTAVRPIHPTIPRYITVREAARLHSFPDWFEFHSTKWHGLRQIGNSVPPRLAEGVARQILRAR